MEYIIVFLPLVAAVISGFFGKKIGERNSEIVTSLFVSISAILSIVIFYKVTILDYSNNLFIASWINSGSLNASWSINIDTLSAVMLVVVTLISALVHIYSIGYMSNDPHKPRFMAYLSLFTFAMITLVTSDNFLQLYFGWEGVGLCSYFLIGFWYKKESANAAAIKAFVVNRIGDFGFALGIFLIFYLFGTVNYNEVFHLVPSTLEKELIFLGIHINAIDLICILLFIGAMGKSAQIFLHTWLPDAMEGPTPVSALIHAATMVTAGVFLVVRCSPIFEYSELALNLITIVGMSTAFFAATIALVQNDIKKIIAYSSVIHMNYLMFGLFAFNLEGLMGSLILMVAHGFVSGGLFVCVGILYDRYHTRLQKPYGGLNYFMPIFSFFFLIFTLANISFPGSINFIGEFLVLLGIFMKNIIIGMLVMFMMIFSTCYALWLYNKIFSGLLIQSVFVSKTKLNGVLFNSLTFKRLFMMNFTDINVRELFSLLYLILPVIYLGLNPSDLIDRIELYFLFSLTSQI